MAAGYAPVDLNNVFISDPDPERLVALAERAGFPINCCTWIKGMFGVVMERGIDTVLCVTSGDCSNTVMLMEVLTLKGVNVIPFAYPDQADAAVMRRQLESFADMLGTTVKAAEEQRRGLEAARAMAHELDELTWRQGLASGWENHFWLVSASDFLGDPAEYEQRLAGQLAECRERAPHPPDRLRLAYIGVPAVFAAGLYDFVECSGAHVVFNEIQRQFAMPHREGSLAEQYSRYTYPYSLGERLSDILLQLRQRRVDGVVHYVQAFCHRGIADIIFRNAIDVPVLTLEGNTEYGLNQHLMTRVEAFIDMVGRLGAGKENS